jgi:hypothetical protein
VRRKRIKVKVKIVDQGEEGGGRVSYTHTHHNIANKKNQETTGNWGSSIGIFQAL